MDIMRPPQRPSVTIGLFPPAPSTHPPVTIMRICLFGLVALSIAGCRSDPPFVAALPESVDRVWIGPDYYANRLMDWRLQDGRIECTEGSSAKPMRTLHLLTRSLDEEPGALRMSVRTGPMVRGDSEHANTWTGFLVGAGGSDIDFRISSLTHHWPGEDGGLIIGVDGTGRIIARDNSFSDGPKGPRSDFSADAWPLLEASSVTGAAAPGADMVLRLDAQPHGGAYRVRVTVRDAGTDSLLGTAVFDDVDSAHLSGNIALVSHNSPQMTGPGYWFEDWRVEGAKVRERPERAFGPIMGTQYTLSGGVLKMTAQLGPLGAADTPEAHLEVRRGGQWRRVATGDITTGSYTASLRVENFLDSTDVPYRVAYDLASAEGETQTHYWAGAIRQPRTDDNEFVLASLNCQNISKVQDLVWNHSAIWYPHSELTKAVAQHDPDMLFFAGDQIYEGGLAGIIRQPVDKAILDYLYHWYRFVWAFRDLTKDRPTVTIPDDHDVYHGNIWGDGGIKAVGDARPMSDNGGYVMDARFVNAVHRTQVSHLPDPHDPTPIAQGISVYYTTLNYGGISFAVIADRMWKATPRKVLPEAEVWNGWPKNPDYDPTVATEATLLGARQLNFLESWAHDFAGDTWMKVMLSQTLFSNLATLPAGSDDDQVVPSMRFAEPGEYIADDHLGVDMDSNGWPQAGRNRALRAIRKGFAFHVGGDQHLGSFVQYGIDAFNDGPNAFISPAIANIWPRRWFPPTPGGNRAPDAPPYTGEHYDGFGNRMTVRAVANPVRSGKTPEALYDRVPGYGVLRFSRHERTITAEAWPRWVDPTEVDAMQYAGWPVRVSQEDNYGRAAAGYLPRLAIEGLSDPVVQITDEASGEILYTLRIQGQSFRPKVFDAARAYAASVGEPGGAMQTLSGLRVTPDDSAKVKIVF